jgi:2'-5' RNA ligase
MRLFTAIDISDEIREALSYFVKRLKPLAKINWSPVDNLHITTKFIGEWPEIRLQEMTAALATVPKSGPIEVTVRGVGWFPNERRPRVFWAGVDGGEPLKALAKATEQTVRRLGVPVEEREFSPHLTLARIRDAVSLDPLRQAIHALPANCGFDFGSFQANEFVLYLSSNGKYTKLATFPLS